MSLIPVGWYDDAAQTTPTHDPGLAVPCPLCGDLLNTEPRTTISVMPKDGAKRSAFFRAHKRCWNAASEAQRVSIESDVIDMEVWPVN
jgi:hypothetical protein